MLIEINPSWQEEHGTYTLLGAVSFKSQVPKSES